MWDIITLFVLPTIVLAIILYICKYYNFSILPSDLKGKKPQKFKMPRFTRREAGRHYKWENIEDSDSSEKSDGDESDEDGIEENPRKTYKSNMYE